MSFITYTDSQLCHHSHSLALMQWWGHPLLLPSPAHRHYI